MFLLKVCQKTKKLRQKTVCSGGAGVRGNFSFNLLWECPQNSGKKSTEFCSPHNNKRKILAAADETAVEHFFRRVYPVTILSSIFVRWCRRSFFSCMRAVVAAELYLCIIPTRVTVFVQSYFAACCCHRSTRPMNLCDV